MYRISRCPDRARRRQRLQCLQQRLQLLGVIPPAAAPTAPSGKVCVYLVVVNNVQDLEGLRAGTLFDRGFTIAFVPTTATPGQDMFFNVTWAYTAP